MTIKKIETLGRTNKSKLLKELGFKNINEAIEAYGFSETKKRKYSENLKNIAYEQMKIDYNEIVDILNQQEQRDNNKIKNFSRRLKTQFENLYADKQDHVSVNIDFELSNGVKNLKKLMEIIRKNYENVFDGDYVVMSIGDTNYVLNDTTLGRLTEYIENNLVETEETMGSDGKLVVELIQNDYITFRKFKTTHKNTKQNGAFFKYYNLTTIDLTRYGIYNKEQWKNNDWENEDECLVHALKMGGLSDENYNYLKTLIKDIHVPLTKLNEICEKLKICIEIKRVESNKQVKDRFIYGKEYDEKYLIGFYDEHYFINEPVEYTSYSIKNYTDLYYKPNFNRIYNKDGDKKDRFITSYELIKILVDDKTLLEKITFSNSQIAKTQYYKKIDSTITDLRYGKQNIKFIDPSDELETDETANKKNKKPIKPISEEYEYKNVFFDFETHTDNERREHTPYLCCSIIETKKRVFYGEDCGLQLLKSLKSNTRLIAHNASYDFRFIIQYLTQLEPIMRGSKLLSATGMFNKHSIQIKCSYHLISMPLSDFSKTFDIPCEKEVMPYSLYNTNNNIKKQFIPLDECFSHLHTKYEKDKFFENAKKWKCFKDGKVDIIKYSKKYCEMDCEVLHDGYNIFRGWIKHMIKLDIDKIITTASLAHKYFINSGCYKGVNQFSGVPQMFIQKCVVGGRTMCSMNTKKIKTGKINDFDAVSLYPSAMYRLLGFLKGVPKIITNLNYDDLKTKDGYFVEIKIKNLGKHRKFPLTSYVNDNGVRIFSNNMNDKIIFVDKTSLEDMIQFHDIKFDIIRGYYFDEGFNPQIKETISFLFNERLKLKKQGNKAEMIYKLLMNSGYGKSIMKPIENEIKVFDDKEKLNVYIGRNYNWIKEFTDIKNNKTILKAIKPLDEHFNIAHVGVSILSMSKRIMNEVMCLGEDLNIDMFYQDTDSIHLFDKDINKLSDSYKQKYNRDLIGKSMGQFHSDFSAEIYEDENGNIIENKKIGKKFGKEIKMKDTYAIKSIFLGKKCYIDQLECISENGKIYTDYHIRMKGIPNSCILYTSKKLGYETPVELYEDLHKGKTITFDLTEDGAKDNFDMKKDYTITTKKKFCREIKF